MVLASQLRAGSAIRFDGQLYKVIAAEYHPGQGKMGQAGGLLPAFRVTGKGNEDLCPAPRIMQDSIKIAGLKRDSGSIRQGISGIGAKKLQAYGAEVLRVVSA